MKPVRYPPDHPKSGVEVTRERTCNALFKGEVCGQAFTQNAVSPDGSKDGVSWIPSRCARCERLALDREARAEAETAVIPQKATGVTT